jgi:hypothetical protein
MTELDPSRENSIGIIQLAKPIPLAQGLENAETALHDIQIFSTPNSLIPLFSHLPIFSTSHLPDF